MTGETSKEVFVPGDRASVIDPSINSRDLGKENDEHLEELRRQAGLLERGELSEDKRPPELESGKVRPFDDPLANSTAYRLGFGLGGPHDELLDVLDRAVKFADPIPPAVVAAAHDAFYVTGPEQPAVPLDDELALAADSIAAYAQKRHLPPQ